MTAPRENWLATRTTLIGRLRDWGDNNSWTTFFDTYGPIIYAVAVKSGLSPAEAEDVVQETVLSVARQMPGFVYDRAKGSFKSWLLTIARSKIVDRWRKSNRSPAIAAPQSESESGTQWIERLPDESHLATELMWEREWQDHLLEAARQRVKASADPRHYQVFDCYVNKGWAPGTVAEKLQVKVEQVYVIKQRIVARLRDEVAKLKEEWRE
jgi:RNA polymerase sigma-70 factor (ECF subfamily)